MTLNQMAAIAKQHWQETYPEAYRLMKQHDALDREAIAAAKLTRREMDALKLIGSTEQEAWQESRTLWVFRDPMKDWQPPEE